MISLVKRIESWEGEDCVLDRGGREIFPFPVIVQYLLLLFSH